jgi:hypothetical protein
MNHVLIVVEINKGTKDIKFLRYYVSSGEFSLLDNNKGFTIPTDAIYKNIDDDCESTGLNEGCISINNDNDSIELAIANNHYGFIRTTIRIPNTFEIFSSDTSGNVLTSNEIGLTTTAETKITKYDPSESSVNASRTDKPTEINKPITEFTGDQLKELEYLEPEMKKDDTKNIIKFNKVLIELLTPSPQINTISNNSNLVDATSEVANAISALANALGKLSPSDITHTKDTKLKNAVDGIASAIGVVANTLENPQDNNIELSKPQSQIDSVSNSSELINPINKPGYALVGVANGLVKSKSEYNVSELIIAKNVMA